MYTSNLQTHSPAPLKLHEFKSTGNFSTMAKAYNSPSKFNSLNPYNFENAVNDQSNNINGLTHLLEDDDSNI